MHRFIAKVGQGQKTAKDLTWEEAKQAVRLLIEGEATAAQVGAFLLAMRFKVESVAELAAFTSAARAYVPPLPVPRGMAVVDLPTYAGKRETFHASIGAAIVAAASGATVLMHGHDAHADRPGTGIAPQIHGLALRRTTASASLSGTSGSGVQTWRLARGPRHPCPGHSCL